MTSGGSRATKTSTRVEHPQHRGSAKLPWQSRGQGFESPQLPKKRSGTNGFWLFVEDHDGCRNRRLVTFDHIRRGHDACRQRHQAGRSPVGPRFCAALCADTALGEGCVLARPAAPGHAAMSSGRLVRAGESNSSFRVDPLLLYSARRCVDLLGPWWAFSHRLTLLSGGSNGPTGAKSWASGREYRHNVGLLMLGSSSPDTRR